MSISSNALIKKIERAWRVDLNRKTKYDNKGGYYLLNNNESIYCYSYSGEAYCSYKNAIYKISDLSHDPQNINEIILKLRIISNGVVNISDWKLRSKNDMIGGDTSYNVILKLSLEPNPDRKKNIMVLNSILRKWQELGKYYYKKYDKYILSNYSAHPNVSAKIIIYAYKDTIIYDYKCLSKYYNKSNESITTISKSLNIDKITKEFLLLFKECHNIKHGIVIPTKPSFLREYQKTNNDEVAPMPVPAQEQTQEPAQEQTQEPAQELIQTSPSKSPSPSKSRYNSHYQDNEDFINLTSTSPIFIPKGLIINS